jgi:hypothetical protein
VARFYSSGALAIAGLIALLPIAAEAGQKRSGAAIYQFKKHNPCPATLQPRGTCPGYVIDHIIALKRGGDDLPSNMQWQTIAEARIKDRWE